MPRKKKVELKPHEIEAQVVGGKTIKEWNRSWKPLEGGFRACHTKLNYSVGLFRAVAGNHIVALGKAVEYNNGGFRKRLADFRRESLSGRNHKFGFFIADHIDYLRAEVLIVGDDYNARKLSETLKPLMVDFHQPSENVPQEIIDEIIAGTI